MPSSSNSKKNGSASTYVMQESKKKAEIQRLIDQHRMITTAMSGVLSEQTDPSIFHRVLDIGCGPGGWTLEVAQTYPEMHLVGVDINSYMLEYAHKQVEAQGLAERVEFREMDVLHGLDFPDNSFDLVNFRLGMSFVRTWDWPKLLLEMQRVARPGGILRLTECETSPQSTNLAMTQLNQQGVQVMYRAGHLFTEESTGLINHLPELLTKSWCEDVQTKACFLELRAGTLEGQLFIEDMKRMYQVARPFLQRWVTLTSEYDVLTRQAQKEMEQPDFCAIWKYVTVWGKKPLTGMK